MRYSIEVKVKCKTCRCMIKTRNKHTQYCSNRCRSNWFNGVTLIETSWKVPNYDAAKITLFKSEFF